MKQKTGAANPGFLVKKRRFCRPAVGKKGQTGSFAPATYDRPYCRETMPYHPG